MLLWRAESIANADGGQDEMGGKVVVLQTNRELLHENSSANYSL